MKTLNLPNCLICAVDVPEGAEDIIIDERFTDRVCFNVYEAKHMPMPDYIPLPPGSWQLLGLRDTITEEQAREIAPQTKDFPAYPDYNFKATRLKAISFFDTALESLHSLLASNGITGDCLLLIERK